MRLDWLTLIVIGAALIPWVYVAARVATRAIIRSLDERDRNGKEKS